MASSAVVIERATASEAPAPFWVSSGDLTQVNNDNDVQPASTGAAVDLDHVDRVDPHHVILDLDGTCIDSIDLQTLQTLKVFRKGKDVCRPADFVDRDSRLAIFARPGLTAFLASLFATASSVSIWTAASPAWGELVYEKILKPRLPPGANFRFRWNANHLVPCIQYENSNVIDRLTLDDEQAAGLRDAATMRLGRGATFVWTKDLYQIFARFSDMDYTNTVLVDDMPHNGILAPDNLVEVKKFSIIGELKDEPEVDTYLAGLWKKCFEGGKA